MHRYILMFSLGFGALLAATQAGHAQATNCAPRTAVVAQLAATYGERRRVIALNNDNSVLELFAADETGSWTIVISLPDGQSCLVAAGSAFQALDGALTLPDEGA